ncbi:MAG TPA: hypothetical protein P5556_08950 [Candidatus Gastranaerophilales bacterium]|nr:hypothetical protein [Candidatus Gastranaerophilales bacterium]
MQEKFKVYTEKLLQINIEINAFFQADNINKITDDDGFVDFQAKVEKLMNEKNSLIENLKMLKQVSKEDFSDLKNFEYKEIWQKIQSLEDENLNLIKNDQRLISEEVADLIRHSKVISSYKFNKEINPRLFDNQL